MGSRITVSAGGRVGTRLRRVAASDTAGQNDVTIGRSAAAVSTGDGRESATDFVLTAVRQYDCQPDPYDPN